MNGWVWLACLLAAPASALTREAVVDAPVLKSQVQPTLLPSLVVPVTPTLAPAVVPALEISATEAGVQSNLAPSKEVPALPRPLAQPEAQAFASDAVPGSVPTLDAGWQFGAEMFDKALDRSPAPVSDFMAKTEFTPAARHYALAVREAGWSGWAGQGAAVSDAAFALLTEKGVKAARRSYEAGGEGVAIAPEKGFSPLNDLAYELKKSYGTSVDFVPERTAGMAAAYNSRENRLLLAGLERPDFFLAMLHEARHAWYAARLRQGKISLFHAAIIAKPGLAIAPDAMAYTNYLSFEELVNHVKTLKHMVTERAKASGEAKDFLEEKTVSRAYQFIDVLRSAAYIENLLGNMDARKKLDIHRLTPAETVSAGLDVVVGVDYFSQDLPRGTVYWPVLKREWKEYGFLAQNKGRKDEALASLRLRHRLVEGLVAASVDPAKDYLEAVKAKDWSAASRAADKLITEARKAETAWTAEQSR